MLAVQVLPHLRIFSKEVLTDVKRKHVLARSRDPYLYQHMGFRNTSRGSDLSTGTTRVKSPTSVFAAPWQQQLNLGSEELSLNSR
jgi:hypothetical protein